jgi:hypothetical protein
VTTALEVPRLGAEQARVATPPLPMHVHPEDECGQVLLTDSDGKTHWCGHTHMYGMTCKDTFGFACIKFLEQILGWKLLPWQRWLYIHALEKSPSGRGFRFDTLVITVARQNGKTRWLKGLGLWRLFLDETGRATPTCPAARLALIAAQNLDYAETMLSEVVEEVRDNRILKWELINHKETNGKHRMILSGRRLWRAATASRRGGRSLTADIVILDELREHLGWEAWNAITPTTIARPYGQVVCASNAGDARSIVLRSLKDQATQKINNNDTDDSKTGYYEWSVPMDVEPGDPAYWWLANPAMGWLTDEYGNQPFTLETLLGKYENMQFTNMPGFRTEYLCQWVDTLQPGIIPLEHWKGTMDPNSCRAPDATVYACVDVDYNRSKAYISIAARRSDGKLHFEVVAAMRGTEAVIPWFNDVRPGTTTPRKQLFAAVAVQVRGAPVSDLVEPMKAAGIPVLEWGGSDLATGTARFFDHLKQRTAEHRPQPVLDRSAEGTVARNLGDSMVLDRRGSPVDAAPLVSCAGAVWAESMGAPEKPNPQIHAWDEDEIARWEAEAQNGDSW